VSLEVATSIKYDNKQVKNNNQATFAEVVTSSLAFNTCIALEKSHSSEIVPTREVSILQNELDAIGNWTSTNNMKLNPKKCKE
jgi:hypothetical protein